MIPSTGRSGLPRLLGRWRADPEIGANVVEWRQIPLRLPRLDPLPDDLHPSLSAALHRLEIPNLYRHQRIAWEAVHRGSNVAVIAGTAGGKTLAYNLPVIDASLRDPLTRALYLFPTKALAQDQADALRRLIAAVHFDPVLEPLSPAIYDGDTPIRHRPAIRSRARLLLTNPDMLHVGILPHHTRWIDFFQNLRFVIIDEAHVYRGVFGSHLANVLRRLTRLAHHYGAAPQFLLTSATLANPQEFTERLIEAPVEIVDEDGSGRGPKSFLIYNPPVIDRSLGLRRSALHESVRLAEDALAGGVQTIVFSRTRRSVELVLSYLRGAPGGEAGALEEPSSPLRGYRSGYLASERRAIERGLRSGEVRLVAATNALELGIDIGGMGAAIIVGYPGSMASTWQQAGRAGRGMDPSLAVLVTGADPLDQFLANNPEYFFGRPVEHALINPDNLLILLDHIRSAAFELPFTAGEGFGSLDPQHLTEFLDFLVAEGSLHRSGNRYFWMADQYPAQKVSLRSASADTILLQAIEDNRPAVIGQVDYASALWMVHPEAIYLHEARPYRVDELDLEAKIARLQPVSTDYYTQALSETTVAPLEAHAVEPAAGGAKAHGDILVTGRVVGFQKVRWYTHEVLANQPLEMPPSELTTTAYWLAPSESTVARLREERLWRSDPNRYGAGWEKQRERARRRDGFRCTVCGASESDRQHDVHHKIPFRLFPDAETANRLENLATLCPTCHRRAEAAVRVRSGLSGLAYVLGHLAPFFLMCDMQDLGVHSDPQSPLAQGSPAIALYDQAPGGIGLSRRLFDLHNDLLARALELVDGCACSDGCPSCVGPGGAGLVPGMPAEAALGGKSETRALLDALTAAV